MQNLSVEFIKKPTAQQNIERKLHSVTSQTINLDWKKIYMLPRQTVISTNIRMFQVPPA